MKALLNHSANGVGAVGLEQLLEVRLRRVVPHRGVSHHRVVGLKPRHLLDGVGAHLGVEAGDEPIAVHEEALSSAELPPLDPGGVRDAELRKYLEEQVLGGAVELHVVRQREQVHLVRVAWRTIGVLHVGGVYAQHAEADVGNGPGLLAELKLTVRLLDLCPYLRACAADALLADVADGLISQFLCH
jgi:hypothetical protein